MSKAKGTGRFVVTHTLVDGHAEGTILHGHEDKADFGTIDYIDREGKPGSYPRRLVHGARKLDTQEQQDRLLKAGAIRELSADEVDMVGDAERLPGKAVPGFAESAPVTDAEKDALIQRLRSENADLRGKHKPIEDAITAGTLAPPKGFQASGLPDVSAVADAERWKGEAAQKDVEIERLRTALAESQQRSQPRAGATGSTAGAQSDAEALCDACTAEELHKLAAKHKVDVPSHATKAEVADALAAKGVKAPK